MRCLLANDCYDIIIGGNAELGECDRQDCESRFCASFIPQPQPKKEPAQKEKEEEKQ